MPFPYWSLQSPPDGLVAVGGQDVSPRPSDTCFNPIHGIIGVVQAVAGAICQARQVSAAVVGIFKQDLS